MSREMQEGWTMGALSVRRGEDHGDHPKPFSVGSDGTGREYNDWRHVELPTGCALMAIRPFSLDEREGHLSIVLASKPTFRSGKPTLEYVTWLYNWNTCGLSDGKYKGKAEDGFKDFLTRQLPEGVKPCP